MRGPLLTRSQWTLSLALGAVGAAWTVSACSSDPATEKDLGPTEEPIPHDPDPIGDPIDIGDPIVADAGPVLDQSCVGVTCKSPLVCSAGECVPNNRDLDNDGVTALTDCNDNDPAIHPGAKESCNNKDDNCDKVIDEGFDVDRDGFYQCAHGTKVQDCDDTNAKKNNPDGIAKPVENYQFTATSDPHWVVFDAATINSPATGWTRLTASQTANTSGSLWWKANYNFDNFVAYATFYMIQGSGTGEAGEGMTFAWVPGEKYDTGNALGFVGLGGYAVAIDTHRDVGEVLSPSVAIVDGTGGQRLKQATIPKPNDISNHTLRVLFDAGVVSVAIDNVNYITDFAIPGYKPFIGHWGFTAGSGARPQSHYVSTVTMIFRNGQGCVP